MCIVGTDLPKFLENCWLILKSDADARISDRYFHRTIALSGVDSDPSSLGSELDRVGKQIEQNLFDLTLVAEEIAKPFVEIDIECNAMPGRALAYEGARVVDRQGKIERGQLQFHAPRFDLGQIEDFIDQRKQMPARGENIVGILGLLVVQIAE